MPARSGAARRSVTVVSLAAAAVAAGLVNGPTAVAHAGGTLVPGDLLVSTSQWTQDAAITSGVTQLPPNCGSTAAPCVTAEAGGSYPTVFNNNGVDGSFGVTQPIVLDDINPTTNALVATTTVPNSTQSGITSSSDQMVTSFSSKSEIALNQSTSGAEVTFGGYNAPVAAIDVSNSNTPGAVDTTNTDSANPVYRVVAALNASGVYQFTETNAYSGNNGRAAILNDSNNSLYLVGNAGNGANPEPQVVVQGVGSQILSQASTPESAQSPGTPTPLGNFNVVQTGAAADKSAKDDNFRGLTVNGNIVYFTKGSGSNGIDTVYYLDTVGGTCPSGSGGGVGLPSSSATLPSAATFTSPTYNTSNSALGLTTANPGLSPVNSCVLNGFPTALAKTATDANDYPFGIWFANPTTLYVADEGAGDNAYSSTSNTYMAAAASTTAGLQKWTLSNGKWVLDYVLQGGLNLGTPYSVANSGSNAYPTGNNTYTSGTGSKAKTITGPWAPAVDGLRNLVGKVSADGSTVTLWATTSTVSFNGDQGADPNALVAITDNLAATSAPTGESFSTVLAPTYGQIVRGVSFTPGTGVPNANTPEAPLVALLPLAAAALLGATTLRRRARRAEVRAAA